MSKSFTTEILRVLRCPINPEYRQQQIISALLLYIIKDLDSLIIPRNAIYLFSLPHQTNTYDYFRRGGRGRPAGKRLIARYSRGLAGLAGEARQSSGHNSDISQAGRRQPAKYLVIYLVLC